MKQLFFLQATLLLSALLSLSRADDTDIQRTVQVNRRDLAFRLEEPFCTARNVEGPLTRYLQAAHGTTDLKPEEKNTLFLAAMDELKGDLPALPQAQWQPVPEDIRLELKDEFSLPEGVWQAMGQNPIPGIGFRIVGFKIDNLQEYGILVWPKREGKFPLIVFVHGAAYGVPDYTLPVLAQLAEEGYVIAAPAFRGEDLLLRGVSLMENVPNLKCEGKIENLVGEPRDVLAIAHGALALDNVQPGKFALVGHSFGAGAGLLAAARSDKVACMVSYDAWLTNPFRFYWERLAGEATGEDKSYLWGSWDEFLKLPPAEQLSGLMTRSIVHHADRIQAPLLLFIGGAYNGSAYHISHRYLVNELKRHGKDVRFEIMPGGGHNFCLYPTRDPAPAARAIQNEWLHKHFPPAEKK